MKNRIEYKRMTEILPGQTFIDRHSVYTLKETGLAVNEASGMLSEFEPDTLVGIETEFLEYPRITGKALSHYVDWCNAYIEQERRSDPLRLHYNPRNGYEAVDVVRVGKSGCEYNLCSGTAREVTAALEDWMSSKEGAAS